MSGVVETAEELNLSKHSKRVALMVAVALDVGYTARQNEKLHISLRSPLHEKSIEIPVTRGAQLNRNREKHLFRQIIRYGDPLKVSMLRGSVLDELPSEISRMVSEDSMINDVAEAITSQEPVRLRRSQITPDPLTQRIGDVMPELTVPPDTKEAEDVPTVDSEFPTKGGSPIIERHWSNGDVDYKCGLDCDYTSPKKMAVAGHIGRSVRHRAVVTPDVPVATVKIDETPVPSMSPAVAIVPVFEDAKEDAVSILKQVRQLVAGDVAKRESGYEETIRVLRAQVAERRAHADKAAQEAAGLRQRVENMQLTIDTLTARAEAAEGRWTALRELVVEEP